MLNIGTEKTPSNLKLNQPGTIKSELSKIPGERTNDKSDTSPNGSAPNGTTNNKWSPGKYLNQLGDKIKGAVHGSGSNNGSSNNGNDNGASNTNGSTNTNT